ncbi:MAG: SdrD B-like domain-containing protein [Bacteroidota bacterium]
MKRTGFLLRGWEMRFLAGAAVILTGLLLGRGAAAQSLSIQTTSSLEITVCDGAGSGVLEPDGTISLAGAFGVPAEFLIQGQPNTALALDFLLPQTLPCGNGQTVAISFSSTAGLVHGTGARFNPGGVVPILLGASGQERVSLGVTFSAALSSPCPVCTATLVAYGAYPLASPPHAAQTLYDSAQAAVTFSCGECCGGGGIRGSKFIDKDSDGIWDPGEPTKSGVVIRLEGPTGGSLPAPGTSLASPTIAAGPGYGRGIAFDGTHLYYTHEGSKRIYKMLPNGTPVTTFTTERPIGALTWDPDEGVLWASQYNDETADIWRVNPSTGARIGPVVDLQGIFGGGHVGMDGLQYDCRDQTLWGSGDGDFIVYHFTKTGTLLGSFLTPQGRWGRLNNTGIAFDGNNLWLALLGTPIDGPVSPSSLAKVADDGTVLCFYTGLPEAIEDLDVDFVTFAPDIALWSHNAYNTTNRIVAYSIGNSGNGGGSIITTTTGGSYAFTHLPPGTYTVSEAVPRNCNQTFPPSGTHTVTIAAGQVVSNVNFGNWCDSLGSICGTKFKDLDGSGTRDEGEPGLENWQINLTGTASATAWTDTGGHYCFDQLAPGSYTVSEVLQYGWRATTPESRNTTLTWGEDVRVDFGNWRYKAFGCATFDSTLQEWSGVNVALTVQSDGTGGGYLLSQDLDSASMVFASSDYHGDWSPAPGLWPRGCRVFYYDIRVFDDGEAGTVPYIPGFMIANNTGLRASFTANFEITEDGGAKPGWHRVYAKVRTGTAPPSGWTMVAGLPGDWNTLIAGVTSVEFAYDPTPTPAERFGLDNVCLTDTLCGIEVGFDDFWNLIGIPCRAVDARYGLAFPSAISRPFKYASGYVVAETLEVGRGYWLKFPSAGQVTVAGAPVLTLGMSVTPGWNLIGSLSAEVDAAAAVWCIPPGIVSSPFYGFLGSAGYAPESRLAPGAGYWVKATGTGEVVMNCFGPISKPGGTAWEDVLAALNRITIADEAGSARHLYFGAGLPEPGEMFELPPPPPEGILDVRFASNRLAEAAGEDSRGEFPLLITSARYPLTITWDAGLQPMEAALRIGEREAPLAGRGSVAATDPGERIILRLGGGRAQVPASVSLLQNFPNPFNPVTVIRYELPEDMQVQIRVYNVLGQEVATLVNDRQEAGYRSVRWDAGRTASGVYFCRLQAGDVTQVKKLILLK